MTVVALTPAALTPARAMAASSATFEVTGAPLFQIPAGALIAPTDLTVRVIAGRAELDLAGLQIDPRVLDPTQARNRIGCRVSIEDAPSWATAITTAVTTEQAWRVITAVLAGEIGPELGYDPESGFPARRDDRDRWRWISYQPRPALTAAQAADLLPYQPVRERAVCERPVDGELGDLPLLGVDPVTGYAAIHTDRRWWWLDYTRSAPLSPRHVADLVAYKRAG